MRSLAPGIILLTLCLAPAASSSATIETAPTATAPPTAPPPPPKLRLGTAVRPRRVAVDLTIVPESGKFQGQADLDLEITEPLEVLWLNATDLDVEVATLAREGAKLVKLEILPGGNDFVGFRGGKGVMAPGRARLHVTWRGKLRDTDTDGLFRQKEGADWYAFSQFEAVSARRAMPCFDEPSFKQPWQLTLHVLKDDIAVSNTPVREEKDEAGGMKRVVFAETQPLPSYLVALGVGPFEFVDGGRAGRNQTQLRVIVPRGKKSEAAHAIAATPEILTRLESYFGTAYPYEKLDQLAIPETVGFGAMENPGLITYSSRILLARPDELTLQHRRRFASVAAHEIAHQWFGDLVTLAFWDDIWLNESFASWMENKIIDEMHPDWDLKVSRVTRKASAMASDSLVTARQIRQPILTKNDIDNAFDGITYSKGAAVLTMFEAWMGPERFQKGVQTYLAAHAGGNATADDFLAALAAVGGSEVAPAFRTFLDQPGVPLVTAELACSPQGGARLLLSQRRFLPTGSEGSSQRTWQVPVCVKYGNGGPERRACTLLTGETGELRLPGPGCPDWVLGNDGEIGYYQVSYRGGRLLNRLLADGAPGLTLPERVGVIGDVSALVSAGELLIGDALGLVPAFAADPNRHIVASLARIASGLKGHLVPEALKPNYARFICDTFGERARALGLTPAPADDDDTRLLRTSLVSLVAVDGEDAALRSEAKRLARRWLDDRSAIDPEMVSDVLDIAADSGDAALFDAFLAAAEKAPDRRDRSRLLGALGGFHDLGLLGRAQALVLDDRFDVRQTSRLIYAGSDEPDTRALGYAFVKQNFDVLAARLPERSVGRLPFIAASFCDDEHRADAESFFRGRTTKFPGGPRLLDQALESMSLCVVHRRIQEPEVAAFLRGY